MAVCFLNQYYCHQLRHFRRLDPDPLAVAIAAMEHLGPYEWAIVQVLFERASAPWHESVEDALINPYAKSSRELLVPEVTPRQLQEKFSSPLFAVSIRLAALQQPVFRQLLGWANQFAGDCQQLELAADENSGDFGWSLMSRCTFRPGMLLNAEELTGLVHIPAQSVASERLHSVQRRTRSAEQTPEHAGSIVLGVNTHRGKQRVARIPAELRTRHCYVAGASGTGKSTLLLNMIEQDISGQCGGLAVLDPHGDLVNAALRRIPLDRVDDVILFNPADEAFPFALNILDAKDDQERERIVSETVMALYRYFPESWGPRLERILTYTIHTVLNAIPGATLADVERILTDREFRRNVVARTTDARLKQFWDEQFVHLPANAVDPVLNKVSVFLMSRTVRNIICQRHSALDFDELINGKKILLANLSTGLLTERIAGMLGSFLVTKIVNAAFRRARLSYEQRTPFYLYVDEFQNFMNLSVGFDRILAEARKYKLVLAGLANQYVGQLSTDVKQAIFGNVGVLATFRLGVDDAHAIHKEMGIFTVDEILSLKRGEAIVRAEGSTNAFNLNTYPEPEPPDHDPTAHIIDRTRSMYARPRDEVERELASSGIGLDDEGNEPPPTDPPSKSKRRRRGRKKKKDDDDTPPDEPRDPSEDDLIS